MTREIVRKSLKSAKTLLSDPKDWSQMTIHANEHGEVITRRENPDGIHLYEAIYDSIMLTVPFNNPRPPADVFDEVITVIAAEIGRRHSRYTDLVAQGYEAHTVVEYNNLQTTTHDHILSILSSCIHDLSPQEDPHPWDSHGNA